jgi:hypothetical protein
VSPKNWEAIATETCLQADETVNPDVEKPQGRTHFKLWANGAEDGLNRYEPYDTRTCLRGSGKTHERNRVVRQRAKRSYI